MQQLTQTPLRAHSAGSSHRGVADVKERVKDASLDTLDDEVVVGRSQHVHNSADVAYGPSLCCWQARLQGSVHKHKEASTNTDHDSRRTRGWCRRRRLNKSLHDAAALTQAPPPRGSTPTVLGHHVVRKDQSQHMVQADQFTPSHVVQPLPVAGSSAARLCGTRWSAGQAGASIRPDCVAGLDVPCPPLPHVTVRNRSAPPRARSLWASNAVRVLQLTRLTDHRANCQQVGWRNALPWCSIHTVRWCHATRQHSWRSRQWPSCASAPQSAAAARGVSWRAAEVASGSR